MPPGSRTSGSTRPEAPLRLLVDACVDTRLAAWLRGRGHDALHLCELGLQRLPDPGVFALAVAERRILLTHDLDFAEIWALGRRHGTTGVVLFRLHDPRIQRLQARLEMVLAECGAALRDGAVVLVEDRRHRVRRPDGP